MEEGILIKFYGGFYYVKAGDKLWECSCGEISEPKTKYFGGRSGFDQFTRRKNGSD